MTDGQFDDNDENNKGCKKDHLGNKGNFGQSNAQFYTHAIQITHSK